MAPTLLAPVILTLGPNHTDGHQQQGLEVQENQALPLTHILILTHINMHILSYILFHIL